METSSLSTIADHVLRTAGIPSPWRATSYDVDDVAKMIQIWITQHAPHQLEKKRSWFGVITTAHSISPSPATGPDLHWRHLNCMDYTCIIHTTDKLDTQHHNLPWFGQSGLPFTNRMSRHVFMCLMEGMEMNALCALLDISFTDLWKFKFGLDSGQVSFGYIPAKKTRQHSSAATGVSSGATPQTMTTEELMPDSAVPAVTDPVWEYLITGDLNIQIKTLSFQLILTKLRLQFTMQQRDEVKIMKMRELHRYVERNERCLSYELKQIRNASQSVSA
jgi:hypothetical protein